MKETNRTRDFMLFPSCSFVSFVVIQPFLRLMANGLVS